MKKHTTYKIGGPAKLFVVVDSISSLREVVRECKRINVEWIVVGKGSNLLVSDQGYEGVVVSLGRDFKKLEFDEDNSVLEIGSGLALSRAVHDAFRKGLSGMEFGVGTPGTIGGAVRMNAGTGQDWFGHHLKSVTVLDSDCNISEIKVEDMEFGYRYSSIANDQVVLSCKVNVAKASSPDQIKEIQTKMDEKLKSRRESQPLRERSCGSVFKNPPGNYAGRLIEEAGLKGHKCGGAQFSTMHCNFIVNIRDAKASDVVTLIQKAQNEVNEIFGTKLYTEVKFLGFDKACSLFEEAC